MYLPPSFKSYPHSAGIELYLERHQNVPLTDKGFVFKHNLNAIIVPLKLKNNSLIPSNTWSMHKFSSKMSDLRCGKLN